MAILKQSVKLWFIPVTWQLRRVSLWKGCDFLVIHQKSGKVRFRQCIVVEKRAEQVSEKRRSLGDKSGSDSRHLRTRYTLITDCRSGDRLTGWTLRPPEWFWSRIFTIHFNLCIMSWLSSYEIKGWVWCTLWRVIKLMLRYSQSKRVFGLIGFCLLCVLLVTLWSISSNSICKFWRWSWPTKCHSHFAICLITGLTVCSTFLWIDLLTLASCLVTFWVEQKKPNKIFTFGHIRCEILFVFVVTILGIFSSLFTLKECFIRLVYEQPSIES